MIKIETFKEYEIQLDPETGLFHAFKDLDRSFSENTLELIKQRISKSDKFSERTPCLFFGNRWYGGMPEIVDKIISSVTREPNKYEKSGYRYTVYLLEGKARSQASLKEILKPTDENRTIVASIATNKKRISELNDENRKLEESLVHFELKDFGFDEVSA